ncbi:preprotein translocase subunit SecG [Pediococcus claussenii]|uniref:Protein-export membrane protein SecG n=1 Tax=Pediococcus claussenii (strain ATCC BAA-344 / DSM 14800 / JCM 18046 / KCTC 3811 / LMG 21948 / P06) TaxID=701521 RepID=G8PC34_PEDCP|nr:preprotein translocase subunit SecG [Pediococcus claussenii]AEV94853.1 preprotein translocase, SecG subunit [Pediococcus claussenii ATCC BAA-344]ANZ70049.1 preprotein translocase subunit SecG [Pediococcus claussenii]ANZ71864.1 preprotein translocase subunit SecG [Pediococcus claussenii]KRN21031.1 secG protein [Pediococcus claussenii]
MYSTLMTALLILSVIIIIAVLMQPSKNESSLASLSGGASELFSQQKARGFEAFMQKVTAILLVLFFVVAIAMVYVSAH